VVADLPTGATLGPAVVLSDSALFDAVDPNSGHRVLVVYQPAAVQGPWITVEHPADSIAVLGMPQMPPAVGVGAANVLALTAVLRHPDLPPTAAVRLDSLVVRCVDESSNPVAPGPPIERMHVLWNGVEVASLADPPATGNIMALGLSGVAVEPGDRDTLALRLDFEAAAPTGTFELILNASGLIATDADTRLPVVVAADSSFEFPILSGLTRISAPPRTLVTGLVDHMPAALAADGPEIVAGAITFLNDAVSGSGSITLDHFAARRECERHGHGRGRRRPSVRLYLQGSLRAEAALQPGDTLAIPAARRSTSRHSHRSRWSALSHERRRERLAARLPGFRRGSDLAHQSGCWRSPRRRCPARVFRSGRNTELHRGGSREELRQLPQSLRRGSRADALRVLLARPARVTLRIWTPRGARHGARRGIARPGSPSGRRLTGATATATWWRTGSTWRRSWSTRRRRQPASAAKWRWCDERAAPSRRLLATVALLAHAGRRRRRGRWHAVLLSTGSGMSARAGRRLHRDRR
jgi:hypothetical protein